MNPDDNQDFEIKEEELEETTEGEEEETSADGEEEEKEEENEEEVEEEEKEEDIPEKFKGKTLKDVIKSYTQLEGMIERKAAEKARELLGKNGAPATKEDKGKILEELKKVDFSKMDPAQFAHFIIDMTEKRALEIARNTYESASTTRERVSSDISIVSKTWPQLKENEGFRDMVVALIENEANKGKILPLKEACERVGRAIGAKPGESSKKDDKPQVKPKTGVERGGGPTGTEKETEEQKIIKGIMGGAGFNKLGGLGI